MTRWSDMALGAAGCCLLAACHNIPDEPFVRGQTLVAEDWESHAPSYETVGMVKGSSAAVVDAPRRDGGEAWP